MPDYLTLRRLTIPYFLYSFSINNRYAGISVATPFTRVRAADGSFETTGFVDPGFAFHMNLFGLPALTKDQIGTWDPKTFLSVHLTVNPPIGSYDRDSPVNVGTNRWAFSPLVNLNIPLEKGVQWIEVYASGKFYTDNDKFQGNKTLSQNRWILRDTQSQHGKRYWASIGRTTNYGAKLDQSRRTTQQRLAAQCGH